MSPSETLLAIRPAAAEPAIAMRQAPLGRQPGWRARIGMIGLASGMTGEREMHQILSRDGVLLMTTRVQDSETVSLANLARMEGELMRAAALIAPGERLDVMAYCCASGAIAIGEARVAERIRESRPGIPVTTQFSCAIAALRTLGAARISLLCPYTAELTGAMRRSVEAEGLTVAHTVAFGIERGIDIYSVTPETILEEAVAADHPEADAVFICCGGLNAAGIIEKAEARIGKPVISSNQSLAWHALRLTGFDDPIPGYGRLMTLGLDGAPAKTRS